MACYPLQLRLLRNPQLTAEQYHLDTKAPFPIPLSPGGPLPYSPSGWCPHATSSGRSPNVRHFPGLLKPVQVQLSKACCEILPSCGCVIPLSGPDVLKLTSLILKFWIKN